MNRTIAIALVGAILAIANDLLIRKLIGRKG